jgi:hypothetical protein
MLFVAVCRVGLLDRRLVSNDLESITGKLVADIEVETVERCMRG